MGVTAGFLAMGGGSVNCVLFYLFNLFLLTVATAIGGPDARANDVQAMMRGAEQTFKKSFAQGFVRKGWPRSSLGQARLALAKRGGQALVGSASAAPNDRSFQYPSAEANPPATMAPPPVARPTREPAFTAIAPSPPIERADPKKAPAQLAKAEPPPPPLPVASISSPAGFAFRDCDFCPELVVVPKGEFMMGSNTHPHDKPAHKVRLLYPFAIGQYEVTYAEWDRCVDAGACRYRPPHQGSASDAIGNLSWDDAKTYLKWMSEKTGQTYRLPSEAEWEYAARAATAKRFWWVGETGSHNCNDCGSGATDKLPAAGSHKPNPFGLYDTAGNMAEWVEDCWNESYQGAPADGSAWAEGNCSLRGLRGGAFGNSSRFRYDSDVRYEANGFRVLRELR